MYRHADRVVRPSLLLKRPQHETQIQLLGVPTYGTCLHPACDPYSFVGQCLRFQQELLDGKVVCTGFTNTGIHQVTDRTDDQQHAEGEFTFTRHLARLELTYFPLPCKEGRTN